MLCLDYSIKHQRTVMDIEECVVCFILLVRWDMYTNEKTN